MAIKISNTTVIDDGRNITNIQDADINIVAVGDGTISNPSMTFSSDTDTGFHWGTSGVINVTGDGLSLFQFSAFAGNSSLLPLSMNGNRIISLSDPVNPQDAATKAYVDANSGGISLTGTNTSISRQMVFTDGSDTLFFDNIGSGITYNPSTEVLQIGGIIVLDGSESYISASFYYGNKLTESNIGPGIDNEFYVFSDQTTTSTRYIAAPITSSGQTNTVAIANRGASGSTTDVIIGSPSGNSFVSVIADTFSLGDPSTGYQFIFDPVGGLSLSRNIDMGGTNRIINLSDPVNPQDAATKAYVDANGGGLTISNDTSTNATRYVTFSDQTSGTESVLNVSSTKLTFNPSTGTLSATVFNELSDSRTKSNIEKIEGALEKIEKINGYTFTKNSEGDKRFAGVIAQEIEKVLPEVVSIDESTGYMSVSYGNIVALLIEAIKEQNKKISELESKMGV